MASAITDNNPNAPTGGRGCLATDMRPSYDCAGPWTVWPHVRVYDPVSPLPTICEFHLREELRKLDADPVVHRVVPGEVAPEQPPVEVPRHENPPTTLEELVPKPRRRTRRAAEEDLSL